MNTLTGIVHGNTRHSAWWRTTDYLSQETLESLTDLSREDAMKTREMEDENRRQNRGIE